MASKEILRTQVSDTSDFKGTAVIFMELCFAVEKTLGKLAKWLRILGFDTLYEQDVPTGDFEHLKEGRILLTRTRRIWDKHAPGNCVLIISNTLLEQLAEVILALKIDPKKIQPFTRCIRCNTLIKPVDKKSVYGIVPDYIWETHEKFQVCNRCKRIYWPGSHIHHSMEKIKQLFEPQ